MVFRSGLNALRRHARTPLVWTLAAAAVVSVAAFGPVRGATIASATASATSVNPSRTAMPKAAPNGWRRVFADDFIGSTLNSHRWRTYAGQPGSDTFGWFDRSHIKVANGCLVLEGYRDGGHWATAGVSSSPGLVQTYGKYLVRFRFNAGAGVAHTILLWPAAKVWPPEIDFSEDNGGNKQATTATLHYGAANSQVHSQTAVDLTQWHTLGVVWTRGKLVYTLDGHAWSTVTSAHVPSIPMVLDIQTQAWAAGINNWEHGVNATTPAHVNLYVDWVVAYAPA